MKKTMSHILNSSIKKDGTRRTDHQQSGFSKQGHITLAKAEHESTLSQAMNTGNLRGGKHHAIQSQRGAPAPEPPTKIPSQQDPESSA